MTTENKQQVAIVTGGSGGIGRAICVELAKTGCYLVVNYMRSREGAEQTLAQVVAAGGNGEIRQFDVRSQEAAEAAVQEIADRLGTIDILINNAGTIADGLFMMMPPENWHGVIETSLHGFYNMTRPVLERMVRARRGSIVSISSAASHISFLSRRTSCSLRPERNSRACWIASSYAVLVVNPATHGPRHRCMS